MADDAETAFLRSMQVANEASGGYEATGVASEQQPDSSSDEYDPAQAVQADSSSHDTDNTSNNNLFNLVGNLDHSPNGNTSQQPPLPSGQSSAKTIALGSFASDNKGQSTSMSKSFTTDAATPQAPANGEVRIHDNEEQDGDVTQSLGNGGFGLNGDTSNLASHSLSNASLKQLSTADVSMQNDVQDQPPSEVVQNGISHTVPNLAAVLPNMGASSHIVPTAMPTETLPVPQVTQPEPFSTQKPLVPPTAIARARLPHDRIGILEDRIKEDLRGDLDAWLSLISEHRKRGKVNDARNIYDRFFTVFPQAVSSPFSTLFRLALLTTDFRPNNGLRMPRWRTKRATEMEWRRSSRGP